MEPIRDTIIRLGCIIALTTLFLTTTPVAQAAHPFPDRYQAWDNAVHGRVVEKQSAFPVANASVLIYSLRTGKLTATVLTDSEGKFSYLDLPHGSYAVVVGAYLNNQYYTSEGDYHTFRVNTGTSVHLSLFQLAREEDIPFHLFQQMSLYLRHYCGEPCSIQTDTTDTGVVRLPTASFPFWNREASPPFHHNLCLDSGMGGATWAGLVIKRGKADYVGSAVHYEGFLDLYDRDFDLFSNPNCRSAKTDGDISSYDFALTVFENQRTFFYKNLWLDGPAGLGDALRAAVRVSFPPKGLPDLYAYSDATADQRNHDAYVHDAEMYEPHPMHIFTRSRPASIVYPPTPSAVPESAPREEVAPRESTVRVPASLRSLENEFGDFTPCIQSNWHQKECFQATSDWDSPNAGSIEMELPIVIWTPCEPDRTERMVDTIEEIRIYKCSRTKAGWFVSN